MKKLGSWFHPVNYRIFNSKFANKFDIYQRCIRSRINSIFRRVEIPQIGQDLCNKSLCRLWSDVSSGCCRWASGPHEGCSPSSCRLLFFLRPDFDGDVNSDIFETKGQREGHFRSHGDRNTKLDWGNTIFLYGFWEFSSQFCYKFDLEALFYSEV